MHLDTYQAETEKTAKYPRERQIDAVSYTALGLVGEAGEVANKTKKFLRGDAPLTQEGLDKLADELGDVLWYVARCAAECGWSLSAVARWNLAKLQDRDKRGVIKGSGDAR